MFSFEKFEEENIHDFMIEKEILGVMMDGVTSTEGIIDAVREKNKEAAWTDITDFGIRLLLHRLMKQKGYVTKEGANLWRLTPGGEDFFHSLASDERLATNYVNNLILRVMW